MKTIMTGIVMLIVGFGLGYFLLAAEGSPGIAGGETDQTAQLYTCGMHPEIISEEPGYCPLCSMKLTPKRSDATAEAGSITIDPTTTQNMGLATVRVENRKLAKDVRAFGKVDYADPLLFSATLKINGWVEKLYVDEVGQEVFKGQPLLDIYSPKLVAAQKELLITRDAFGAESDNSIMASARERLKNWDISDRQIEQLLENGLITRNMTLKAPYDGIILQKNVDEGAQLKAGRELYKIADLSSVWIKAYVYEQDLPFINLNQSATVSFPNLPGQNFPAKVIYIAPFLNSQGQVEVRFEMANRDYLLKPEMYAEVSMSQELPRNRLAIPRSAVINSGAREIVYINSGDGNYSPQEIETGIVDSDDRIEVVSGLSEGDQVVVSGQFLLDSEARLSEALGGEHMHHGHASMTDDEENGEEMHDHAASANNNKEKPVHDVYTCPMPEHFHVMQYGEGKCGECGMDLVPIDETENRSAYVCPMPECETAQDEPGRCSVCGMHLKKLTAEPDHD